MIIGSFELTILLSAATVLGITAYYLKQPTLVAYLFAGIIIGPSALGLTDTTPLTETAAELGLAFLLFLIGLELNFNEIKHILRPVTKISVGVMASLCILTTLTGVLIGLTVFQSFLLGLAFMYSSTAIVEKFLSDMHLVDETFGELNTGNLIIQDLAVVLLMVIITSTSGGEGIIDSLAYASVFLVSAIGLTLIASKILLPRLMSYMASRNLPIFITGMAWLFLFLVAAEAAGMSIEIGAFIAGLGLGQLNFSEEIKYEIKPLTELFIAFFFLNFGMGISEGNFLSMWPQAVLLALVLMVSKLLLTFTFTRLEGYSLETSLKSGLTMMQTSEFSLVFAATLVAAGLITDDLVGLITLVAILTMTASSYVIIIHEKIVRKILGSENEEKSFQSHAIVLGYENNLEGCIEILTSKFDAVTVIDDEPRKEFFSANYVYGGVYHEDLRSEEGIKDAEFVMVNINDRDLHEEILEENKEGLILLKTGTNHDRAKTYSEDALISGKLSKLLRQEGWRGSN